MIIRMQITLIDLFRISMPSMLGLLALTYLSLSIINKYDRVENYFLEIGSEIIEFSKKFDNYDIEDQAKLADYIINKENDAYKDIFTLLNNFEKIFKSFSIYPIIFLSLQLIFIFFLYHHNNKSSINYLNRSILYAILFCQIIITLFFAMSYITNYKYIRFEMSIWFFTFFILYSTFIIYCAIFKHKKTLLAILLVNISLIYYAFSGASPTNIIMMSMHLYFLSEITYCTHKLGSDKED